MCTLHYLLRLQTTIRTSHHVCCIESVNDEEGIFIYHVIIKHTKMILKNEKEKKRDKRRRKKKKGKQIQ